MNIGRDCRDNKIHIVEVTQFGEIQGVRWKIGNMSFQSSSLVGMKAIHLTLNIHVARSIVNSQMSCKSFLGELSIHCDKIIVVVFI